MGYEIVLASASPRRKKLLEEAGIAFSVHAADVDESLEPALRAHPARAVQALAERKAHAVLESLLEDGRAGRICVIGADTVVVLDGVIFGKPADEEDAARMLHALSGRTHAVHTGVALLLADASPEGDGAAIERHSFTDITHVTFRALSDAEIAAYVATGEPLDKAGAYGYQERAGVFVERLDGAEDTVIGLPVGRLLRAFPDVLPGDRRTR